MTTFWYGALGFLFAAYFALGGLDIGVGLVLPAFRDAEHRRDALNAIGPFFLGNEVWIVGAAGIMLAAFPGLESALFEVSYPLIFVLVAGLVAINVGVQLRSRPTSAAGRARFDALIVGGALVLAVGWGVFIGNLLTGLPVGGVPVFATGWFPVLVGVASAVVMAAHGTAYLSWRLPERPVRDGRWLLMPLAAAVVAAVAVLGMADAGVRHAVARPALALGLAGAIVVLLLVATGLLRTGRARPAFVAAGLSLALPVALVGLALFPNVLVTTGPAASVTVASGAAGDATLQVLTWACAPVIPLLVALQALSWSVFTTRRSRTRYW